MTNRSVGGDDRHGWDPLNSVVGIKHILAADDDRPGDFAFFNIVSHQSLFFFRIAFAVRGSGPQADDGTLKAGHAHDFDIVAAVVFDELPHVWKRLDAGAAPRRPEIEHHNFAARAADV